jgi:hypothetical protein
VLSKAELISHRIKPKGILYELVLTHWSFVVHTRQYRAPLCGEAYVHRAHCGVMAASIKSAVIRLCVFAAFTRRVARRESRVG